MGKKLALIFTVFLSPSLMAHSVDNELSQEYSRLLPIAESVSNKTRLLTMRAEKLFVNSEANMTAGFNQDIAKLEAEASSLGANVFAKPFGHCAVLPKIARQYIQVLALGRSSIEDYKRQYIEMRKDCLESIRSKPESDSSLAVLDVSYNPQ